MMITFPNNISKRCGITRNLLLLFYIIIVFVGNSNNGVTGQRFMRQGFSNNEDFGAEMKLDTGDDDAAVGMTREMFLMKDIKWHIPSIEFHDTNDDCIALDNKIQLQKQLDASTRQHITNYLGGNRYRKPMVLSLFKKRGKFGLRAIGTIDNGKKLRAFWRQATTDIPKTKTVTSVTSSSKSSTTESLGTRKSSSSSSSSDFLKMSYDDAIRTRLFTVEFEVQLPPLEKNDASKKSKTKVMPSIIYQIPVESGSMNPKAIIPRGVANVLLYPEGRSSNNNNNNNKQPIPVHIGTCRVGVVPMRPGIVDPSWSKGRPIFRKGRSTGII